MANARTHHLGLPVYRWSDPGGDLVAGRVASRTELRRQRRVPAEGQQPCGYYWQAREWIAVYRTADTVELPPLTGKRAAAYVAVRTCARCGATQRDPYRPWQGTMPRVCEDCVPVEREVHWRATRTTDRRLAVALAGQLLADPNLALYVERLPVDGGPARWMCVVAAVDLAGNLVIAEELLVNRDMPGWQPPEHASRGVPLPDRADQLRALATRRLLPWTGWTYGGLVSHAHKELDLDLEPRRPALHEGDVYVPASLCSLARIWLGLDPQAERPHRYSSRSLHTYWEPSLERMAALAGDIGAEFVPPGVGPDAALALADARAALAILQMIAADRHPDGDPTCPQRRAGATPCGEPATASGYCTTHTNTGGKP